MSKYSKAIRETKSYSEYKANKYPNGYIPKIEYWSGYLNDMLRIGDIGEVLRAAEKIKYFATCEIISR